MSLRHLAKLVNTRTFVGTDSRMIDCRLMASRTSEIANPKMFVEERWDSSGVFCHGHLG
jgi:hypothetical protein